MQEKPDRANRKITIRGLPVFSGAVLSAESTALQSLQTAGDFVRFARRLRGQFCILVEDGTETIAISDFGGSLPVFYLRDDVASRYRVSPRLADLVPFSKRQVSKEALFFYVSRAGVGIDPFYSDIKELLPATVASFRKNQVELLPYLEWQDYLEIRPIDPDAAERRFIEIASEYLSAITRGRGPIACLLSGGTDSALIAWLLRSIQADVRCLTADFQWSRYSEYSEASENAIALKLPHERVLVKGADYRSAFLAINSADQNGPCCHAQTPVLFQLARHALANGSSILATGDHADALFLGFDHFFRGFPKEMEAYRRTISALDTPAKLDRLYSPPSLSPDQENLLSVLGSSGKECMAWEEQLYAKDRKLMSQWVGRAPLHTLQQLSGQIWAGVSWQNIFLPVTCAFNDQVEFVSPFYDLEMVKFALSLPPDYKFRNGATKVLLRDTLYRVLQRSIAKRASPAPNRIWRLLPSFKERTMQVSRLRSFYDQLSVRNLFHFGKLWQQLDKVSALSIWLSAQQLKV